MCTIFKALFIQVFRTTVSSFLTSIFRQFSLTQPSNCPQTFTSTHFYSSTHFFLLFFLPDFRFFLISFFFQQLASLSLVELCKAASGEDGCTTVSPAEISVLLHSLESPAASLRFATLQGLLVLTDILSAGDHGTAQTAQLVRRLWVAKFDVDDENAKLGGK